MFLIENFLLEKPRALPDDMEAGLDLSFCFLRCGQKNKNGRVYPKAVVESAINSAKPWVDAGRAFGGPNHPAKALEVEDVSHVVRDIWLKENEAWTKIHVVPTTKGKNIMAILKHGGVLGISARGEGAVDESGLVKPGYRLLAMDFVLNPSFPDMTVSAQNAVYESVKMKDSAETMATVEALKRRFQMARISGFRGDFSEYCRIFKRT